MHRDHLKAHPSEYVTSTNPFERLNALAVIVRWDTAALPAMRQLRAQYQSARIEAERLRTGWRAGTVPHEVAWPQLCAHKDRMADARWAVMDTMCRRRAA